MYYIIYKKKIVEFDLSQKEIFHTFQLFPITHYCPKKITINDDFHTPKSKKISTRPTPIAIFCHGSYSFRSCTPASPKSACSHFETQIPTFMYLSINYVYYLCILPMYLCICIYVRKIRSGRCPGRDFLICGVRKIVYVNLIQIGTI